MENKEMKPQALHGGCFPPPTEIACIWVKKIYDACSQRECEEFVFEFGPSDFPPGAQFDDIEVVECEIIPGSESFKDETITPIDGGPLGRIRARVCAKVRIVLQEIGNPTNQRTFERKVCFDKDVILYAPDPVNMQVLVESIFEALLCEGIGIGPPPGPPRFDVTVTVGAFIIVKTALFVQLLVPAYGFCPVPPECEELGDICEQFLERPFPPFFPPQLSDL